MATPEPAANDDRKTGGTVTVAIVALVAVFAMLPRFFPPKSALSGKDAPDVPLKVVANAPPTGTDLSLSGLRGQAVLLDFWATWCGPCQEEAPILDRISQRYQGKGLTVVGVDTSDEAGRAGPFAVRHHLSYPIAYDEGQRAATAYGVENLPTLIMISKEGKVVGVRTGVTTDSDLEDLIKTAL